MKSFCINNLNVFIPREVVHISKHHSDISLTCFIFPSTLNKDIPGFPKSRQNSSSPTQKKPGLTLHLQLSTQAWQATGCRKILLPFPTQAVLFPSKKIRPSAATAATWSTRWLTGRPHPFRPPGQALPPASQPACQLWDASYYQREQLTNALDSPNNYFLSVRRTCL